MTNMKRCGATIVLAVGLAFSGVACAVPGTAVKSSTVQVKDREPQKLSVDCTTRCPGKKNNKT